ncbi:MAG: hypothetical protein KDI31_14715 [Pseudomonadales bacterium]|nr:hypothetical protein [Pseudomonadales bacterium]
MNTTSKYWFTPAILAFLTAACTTPPADSAERPYDLAFQAHFAPEQKTVTASIRVSQGAGELRILDLSTPKSRFSDFTGDGSIRTEGPRTLWSVPKKGGELRYRVTVDHRRHGAFDARMTDSYAIFRLDDLFPSARVRSRSGASSRASLSLTGPDDWSFETRFGPLKAPVAFDNPSRRFDRPTGWAIAGKIGIRRDDIGGVQVAVAAPVGDDFRRQDTLAFLNWTLPEVIRIFPGFPRLLIVGAGGEFWLGGLSGPGSLFLHSDRPLISENRTSALIHELVHVATSSPPAPGDDWILEGIAEFYALEILHRSGGTSTRRAEEAFAALASWVSSDGGRLTDPSTGANTARAALLFRELAAELDSAGSSIDVLAGELFSAPRADRERLRAIAQRLLGRPSKTLKRAYAELDEE